MTQTDPRPPQRDLPDRIQDALTGMRDRIGANRAVAATAAVVAVVLLVAIVAAVIASGGGPAPQAGDDASASAATESGTAPEAAPGEHAPALPADGAYLVRQESTGLCLTLGPEIGNETRTVVVIGDCAATEPAAFAFAAQGAGVYTVGMELPDWSACLGVDAPGDGDGYLTAAYECADDDLQRFQLTERGDDTYAVAVTATGLCLSLLWQAEGVAGEAIGTTDCDDADPHQRFALLVP
ncbi:RICIN domain-containing protein [Glycomyces terrestris]|uniref:RICIN domain-containing protein n=1 Tax=Glycomyces terrestris TaxID=2493553 RepID=UPI0013158418|nr:RICIN domain-containing protein [Glycomyces terrestris]